MIGGHLPGHGAPGGFGGGRFPPDARRFPVDSGPPRSFDVAGPPPGYGGGPGRFGGRGPSPAPSQSSWIGTQRPPRPRTQGPPISGAQRPRRGGGSQAGSIDPADSISEVGSRTRSAHPPGSFSEVGSRASSAQHPRGRSGMSEHDY